MSDIREALMGAMGGEESEEAAAPVETVEVAAPPEAVETPEAEAAPAAEATETPAQAAQRARDEAGRFAKQKSAAPVKPTAVKPTPKAQAAPTTTTGTTPPASTAGQTPPAPLPAAEAVKAPQSWKPAAREHFATLPPEVQQEVVRRERETAVALQQAASHRQTSEAFQKTLEPYRALLTDEPMRVVGNLLQTAAALQTAPAAHKAQLVARIVREYGVDIHALDEALSGAQPAANSNAPQASVDPNAIAARVRQELLQGLQQQRQVAAQQKAAQEVEAFASSAEFMDDVREDVADMMELASRRGVALTLEAAYNRACQMHPEVSKVLQQREAAKAANATQASTQRARAASSSVTSRPAVGPKAPVADDWRSALEAAMTANSGR